MTRKMGGWRPSAAITVCVSAAPTRLNPIVNPVPACLLFLLLLLLLILLLLLWLWLLSLPVGWLPNFFFSLFFDGCSKCRCFFLFSLSLSLSFLWLCLSVADNAITCWHRFLREPIGQRCGLLATGWGPICDSRRTSCCCQTLHLLLLLLLLLLSLLLWMFNSFVLLMEARGDGGGGGGLHLGTDVADRWLLVHWLTAPFSPFSPFSIPIYGLSEPNRNRHAIWDF